MTRLGRNPRRAYDKDGREIEPMMLDNMAVSLHSSEVWAECQACKREVRVDVGWLPGSTPVPDVALRLRCSACDSRDIVTRPRLPPSPYVAAP